MELTDVENIFLALADKTRLRILNLMRDGEVCVDLLSKVLELSQPKISRHLAYLRNAGVVSTRRNGKWIFYRIDRSISPGCCRVLTETLDLLASRESLKIDYERFLQLSDSDRQVETSMEIEAAYEPQSVRRDEIETFLL